jgi:hypothetical protein
MIEHEEARLQLADLVVPGLADATRIDDLRTHLSACASCRAELADLELLDGAIRDAGPAPVPSDALTRSVLAIAGSGARVPLRRSPARRALRSVALWRAATGFAAVGAAALAIVAVRTGAPALQVSQTRAFAAGPGWHASGSVAYGTLDGVPTVHVQLANLPALKSGYYELWVAKSPTERLSLGVFDASPAGTIDVTLPAPGGSEGYKGIWLTNEPEDNNPMWSPDTVAAARLA